MRLLAESSGFGRWRRRATGVRDRWSPSREGYRTRLTVRPRPTFCIPRAVLAQPSLANLLAPIARGAPPGTDQHRESQEPREPLRRRHLLGFGLRRDPRSDLHPRVEPELVQDAPDVALHGPLRDEKTSPDLFIGQAFSDQPCNVRLAFAK